MKFRLKTELIVVVLVLLIGILSSRPDWRGQAAQAGGVAKVESREWRQLFNGKNLEGWDLKIRGYGLNENFGHTFRVEDGMLTVGYEKYDQFNERFGHIFYREKFSHYIIAVEYRFIGEQAK
ncbi:MAG: hypothetical protein RIR52_191, partial [Acidobacteriota bacterium]